MNRLNPAFLLAEVASEAADRPAAVCGAEQIAYSQLLDMVRRLAGGLKRAGLEEGARIAVLLDNSLEWMVAYYASQWMGAVFAPLDLRLTAHEIAAILADLQPQAAIVGSQLEPSVRAALRDACLIQAGPGGDGTPLARLLDGPPLNNPLPRDEEAPSAILYTSGTTATPRGAVIPLRAWDASIRGLSDLYDLSRGRAWLIFAPMSHVSGPMYCNMTAYFRGCLIIIPCLRPSDFIDAVQRYRPIVTSVVPSVLTMLLKAAETRDIDLSCFELLAAFGAPTPPSLRRQFEETFGVKLQTGYGLTEVVPFVSLTPPWLGMSRPYCVGQITRGVHVRILDAEEQPLPTGEVGEIVIAGGNVMLEYWRKPQETASVLRNGWFFTGDLGKVDEDGMLYVVGRKKDMIIVGGHNVYAAEVEETLMRHPAVAQVAAIGVSDALRGEAIKAVVVLHPGRHATATELAEHARRYLASYKVPKVFEFREELPVSRTGKVDKRKLQEEPLYEEWVT